MDPQLVLFRRQYLQLFEPDFLAWPPGQLLNNEDAQAWIRKNLFDKSRNGRLPPASYQIQVLRPLVAKIEKLANVKFEENTSRPLEELKSHLTSLEAREPASQVAMIQQNAHVTFTCLPENSRPVDDEAVGEEPTITLLEQRRLVSGSQVTGFLTWPASLHLGAYLLSTSTTRALVRDKSVLELGAGTGFLSVLCAKHLGAAHVTATDGDAEVVGALGDNMDLNGLDARGDKAPVKPSVLRWGSDIEGTCVEDDLKAWPYDVVIGADIAYHLHAVEPLVRTLRGLFIRRPALDVLIAAAVRNAKTFEAFEQACLREKFVLKDVDFRAKPVRQQTALFYAAAIPFRILSIGAPGVHQG